MSNQVLLTVLDSPRKAKTIRINNAVVKSFSSPLTSFVRSPGSVANVPALASALVSEITPKLAPVIASAITRAPVAVAPAPAPVAAAPAPVAVAPVPAPAPMAAAAPAPAPVATATQQTLKDKLTAVSQKDFPLTTYPAINSSATMSKSGGSVIFYDSENAEDEHMYTKLLITNPNPFIMFTIQGAPQVETQIALSTKQFQPDSITNWWDNGNGGAAFVFIKDQATGNLGYYLMFTNPKITDFIPSPANIPKVPIKYADTNKSYPSYKVGDTFIIFYNTDEGSYNLYHNNTFVYKVMAPDLNDFPMGLYADLEAASSWLLKGKNTVNITNIQVGNVPPEVLSTVQQGGRRKRVSATKTRRRMRSKRG